jgi:hypothetical protein
VLTLTYSVSDRPTRKRKIMNDIPNDTTEEQLKRITSAMAHNGPLPAEEVKRLWIKYYVDRWKLDPVVLAEAYDRAYRVGWLDGCDRIEGASPWRQVQTPGLGISYPDDYRIPNETDPDYFNPEWKSC